MAHLLHIDVSPRGERSHTRRLSRELVDAWLRSHPNDRVTYRDIGRNPPPHVDDDWIAAAFTTVANRTAAMQHVLRVSDALIAELVAADVLVIGLPMYNFSVPSSFKAYIDQIVRVGVTFAFDPEDEVAPYKPLVHGVRAVVIVASGDAGYEPGGRFERQNHVDPYLRTLFGFIGIDDVTFVHVGNDEFGGERLARALAAARVAIAQLTAA
jgi:FMN-dependent NADH-azoreductase